MELLSVVVTYYPNIEEARHNILAYIQFVDKLIIWENTPLPHRDKYRIELLEYQEKILYMSTDKNEGIALPLNRAVEYGINEGYTHLLTMDQDSKWLGFEPFRDLCSKYEGKYQIFCPNVNNSVALEPAKDSLANTAACETDYVVVPTCITSGTIYGLGLFEKIGGFREDYVIDAVDIEICYRAKKLAGINTICFPQTHLRQNFGNVTRYRFGFSSKNYSAFRTYHIIRNHLWLWREYPKMMSGKSKRHLVKYHILKKTFHTIFLESDKLAKLSAIFRGVCSGVFCCPTSSKKSQHIFLTRRKQ